MVDEVSLETHRELAWLLLEQDWNTVLRLAHFDPLFFNAEASELRRVALAILNVDALGDLAVVKLWILDELDYDLDLLDHDWPLLE